MLLDSTTVALARLRGSASYPPAQSLFGFPGPPRLEGAATTGGRCEFDLVRQLFREAGFDATRFGQPDWNPLGELIHPGDSVVLKPNFVCDRNYSGRGMDCMVTHASVLAGVLHYALLARPGKVVVGDAPIQGCDWGRLMDVAGYASIKAHYAAPRVPVEWVDFRRAVVDGAKTIWSAVPTGRADRDYVLVDLGRNSLLEPISAAAGRFRVTRYNPDLMRQTHAPGKHQYLIAREVLEANVIISLPKLKTHQKTGITGALKNVVGINGNKDFLPHHRLGGSKRGGDCYEGSCPLKLAAERFTDAANRSSGLKQLAFRAARRASLGLVRRLGEDADLEGSWHGNDTIWRTCLDLNRVLLNARIDGTLAETQQRRVLTITDAIICGEGNGPLAPTPRSLGVLTCATNALAAEYVHAHLMGFDWRKIPIIREGFEHFAFPVASFGPQEIKVLSDHRLHSQPWPSWNDTPFRPAPGWEGHCESELPHA